jgi:acyl-CoA synthetase (AMP-forming)/AMP-acid ligase II
VSLRVHPVNLGDLIDPAADPATLAIIDLREPERPREHTYAALEAMARGAARLLMKRGFAPGSRIAILALNRAEYVAVYLGIMRAGLVAVPVNIKLPLPTIEFVLDDSGAALAFADAERMASVPSRIPTIGFDDPGPGGFASVLDPGEVATWRPSPGDIAQLLYTSGSTGRPKGVKLSHAGQIWAVEQRGGLPGADRDRFIVAAPLFHMNALFNTKLILYNHASMVLLPSFTARPYLEAIARYGITALNAVPTMLARAAKETDLVGRLDLGAVKRVGMGSAPLTMALIERVASVFPSAVIRNGYGTTEAGPAVFGPHPGGIPIPPLSLGYPLPGAAVKLVDGPGEDEGVLLMRNPSVMAGYHNLPQQTARALRDGWYWSGDVMRRDENGFFYFVGRADDMFVCSGENIYPGEVETLLERHPAIHQACVVPLPDDERGHVPVAFLVPRPGMAPSVEEIKHHALANGPAYQHPRRIRFLVELPWAGTNKIDRAALTARARELEAEGGWSS